MDKNQRKNEIKEKIYAYLREGLFKKQAAILAGISEKTFYRWMEEDKEFARQVDMNIAEYMGSLIDVLNIGMVKNPRIAFKILAMRWPDEWDPKRVAKRQRYKEESRTDTQELADKLKSMLEEGRAGTENDSFDSQSKLS